MSVPRPPAKFDPEGSRVTFPKKITFFPLLFSQLTGPTDHSYFDSYPPDEDSPPDELSGWDVDF